MQRLIHAVLALLAAASLAHAQVPRKCIDAAGKVSYSDQPCPDAAATRGVKIIDNVVDSREERARSARTHAERLEADRVGQQRAAALTAAPGSGEEGSKFNACTDEVNRRGGLSARQREDMLSRCRGATAAEASSSADDCVAKVRVMTALTALQRANAIVGCRSGNAPAPSPSAGNSAGGATAGRSIPIAGCDSSGCWDTAGERYNAQGVYLISTSGRQCQRAGNLLRCE